MGISSPIVPSANGRERPLGSNVHNSVGDDLDIRFDAVNRGKQLWRYCLSRRSLGMNRPLMKNDDPVGEPRGQR